MNFQAGFCAALMNPQADCPAGLVSWNGSDPAQRFAVYRNNVLASRIGALADTFPVIQSMVGDRFFQAMAAVYVQAHPPASPVLVDYGDGFAPFIAGFAPASGLPYLADLARLEWAYVQAFHAADADALPLTELVPLLADEQRLAGVRFRLHPSVQVLRSPYAVHSLWAAHQADDPGVVLQTISPDQPESAVVLRKGLMVEVVRVESGAAVFFEQVLNGVALAEAVSHGASFDLAGALQLLLGAGAITHYQIQE